MPHHRRRWWLLLLILPAAALAALIFLVMPHRLNPGTTALGPAPTGSINILIIGRDARALVPAESDGRRRVAREADCRSDVVLILHADLDRGRIDIVGLPRDMLVHIPGVTGDTAPTDFTHKDKLTHVHAIGGEPLLRRTLESLLGITIHRFVAFDFDSFRMTLGLLRPFLAGLRVGGEPVADRGRALLLARRRDGLPEDDIDRTRNNLLMARGVIGRTWRYAGTRLGQVLIGRVLAVIGPDTDLTGDEIDQIVWGLANAGFEPGRIRTAVLVGEGASVFLARYDAVLSCYLPAYGEIRRQVDRFLRGRDDVAAIDFMTRQEYDAPGYLFENWGAPETLGPPPDSSVLLTRLREMEQLGIEPDSGN